MALFSAFYHPKRQEGALARALPRLAACLAAGVWLCAAPPAQAFSLFGLHLWGKEKAKDSDIIGEPKYYSVDFAPLPAAGGAAQQAEQSAADIKLARAVSALYAGRKRPAAGSGGVLAKARGDYARILAAFYAAGRYGPVISILINGQEAADIPYGAELPARSKIVIRAAGGPFYRFSAAQTRFSGKTDAADRAAVAKKLAAADKALGFSSGQIAASGKIFGAEAQAVAKWREAGYAKARNIRRAVVADHKTRALAALIVTAPGQKARFGALRINNVSPRPRMNSQYVAWITGLRQGAPYSPAALAKANARLAKLQVFRSANLEEADKIQPNGALPLSLTLQEQPLHRFGAGGSYATADGLGASAYWLQRNLWGRAERLRFDAAVSNIMGTRNSSSGNPNDYTYSLGGSFVRPGVITPDTDYLASLKAEREVLDDYRAKGLYFSSGFNHVFSSRLSGRLYAQAGRVRVQDDTWGKRNFTALGFLGGLTYDSRDNAADARKGFYGALEGQPFYEAEYGNFVGKITAEGRLYHAFDQKGRLIAALRGKIGSISGAPIAELPSNMLYFIGGGGSVRGYAYRSIGVYKKNGSAIGGRSMVEGSAELRAMVSENIGITGFIDGGIAGKNPMPDFEQNAKFGAGLGLRYKTGLGPLRLDAALPLNREKGDARYGLYIGIGQAF